MFKTDPSFSFIQIRGPSATSWSSSGFFLVTAVGLLHSSLVAVANIGKSGVT